MPFNVKYPVNPAASFIIEVITFKDVKVLSALIRTDNTEEVGRWMKA